VRGFRTIGSRLTASFLALLGILICLGFISLARLESLNAESAEIRERWLKTTRYLGDLSNYTSDFRALEGAFLLSPQSAGAAQLKDEQDHLDADITRSRSNFESIAHDSLEVQQYVRFKQKWTDYRAQFERAFALLSSGDKDGAIGIYFSSSRKAFAEASEQLDQLSELNNLRAQQAGDRAAAAIQEAWRFIRGAIAFSCLTGLALLLYITRKVSLPLRDLSKVMLRLAGGEMDIEIDGAGRRDELGDMARSVGVFRANAVELRLGQRGLASQASMLEEKLAHERMLSEQQRNFMSMASHEFRTPMALIDGHAQRLINANDPSAENIVARARKIRTAVKRMSVMIDRLLSSCRLVDMNPELYFHPQEFDMRALLHEVCKLHREISPSATIYEELGCEPLRIHGDKNLLFQVFSNLVANAVKYSPGGGMIQVSASVKGDVLLASVEDNGIGIPEKDQERLFERYHRGSNVGGIVGAGIGMFLAKLVVDLHRGQIGVESEENHGTRFAISLPRVAAGQESAAASQMTARFALRK
jgi:two-component system, OmpR family, sensor kinase